MMQTNYKIILKLRIILLAALICAGILSIYGSGYSGITSHDKARDVVDVGSRLELMVDGFIIDEYLGDIRHKLHYPQPQNVAIVHDMPWEAGTGVYHTVFKDGDLYRMYYKGDRDKVCYAESYDGITFTRPDLGIIEFEGSKANNIIWKGGPISHNFTPFKDTNPDCRPEHRYKAVGGIDPAGLFALVSADGIHWSKLDEEPVITDGHFDSQNLAFWDNRNGHYRAYWRDWHREDPPRRLRGIITDRVVRGIRTATSEDFINWTPGQWLKYPNAPDGDVLLAKTHLYTNAIRPYYRAPHIYIGFPARYVERDFGESSRQLPNAEAHEQRMRRIERGNAQTEGLLITSRDGITFNYWSEAFIRPGLRSNNWVYGNNYIAWHVVETVSDEPGNFPELSLYARTNVGTQGFHQLLRYTLRLDGFVSLNASLSGGAIITRPIRFNGEQLIINYSTSAAGSLRIEILDSQAEPIPGYTLSECDEIYGDQLERTVTWQGKSDLSELQEKIVRLRFVLKDADLFSFTFRK